mgnify:CR=1 FL=1
MSKKSKGEDSDQKDWKNFLNNPLDIFDKEKLENKNQKLLGRYKFDFHGYSIDDANKKVEELISTSFEKGVSELLIVTGKGTHSNKEEDVYTSKEYSKLQNTLPEFIKNNPELSSKIEKIKQAPQELGGDGALVIKLKKIKE